MLRAHLATSEVVSPLFVLSAPAASEGEPVALVCVGDRDAEILALVALLHVARPLRPVVVRVVVLVVAEEAGARGDGRGLAAEVLAVAHVLPAHADHRVVVTLPVVTVVEALTLSVYNYLLLRLTL